MNRALLTKLFDHKAVILNINIKNGKYEPKTDNKAVKYPGMKEEAALVALQLFDSSTDIHLNPTITELTQVINDLKNTVIYKVKLIKKDALINQYCHNLVE